MSDIIRLIRHNKYKKLDKRCQNITKDQRTMLLYYACFYYPRTKEVIDLLIYKDANQDCGLPVACYLDNLDLARLLLEREASLSYSLPLPVYLPSAKSVKKVYTNYDVSGLFRDIILIQGISPVYYARSDKMLELFMSYSAILPDDLLEYYVSQRYFNKKLYNLVCYHVNVDRKKIYKMLEICPNNQFKNDVYKYFNVNRIYFTDVEHM